MEKYLKSYILELEIMADVWDKAYKDEEQKEKMKKSVLTKIKFFQHERLIHLIVTVTFAIGMLLSLILCFLSDSPFTFALPVLFLILLIPYVRHYYILENGVQRLYYLYDRLPS